MDAQLPNRIQPRQGVIILCGEGDEAFCSGGDQVVRGEGGYDDGSEAVPRLGVLDLQVRVYESSDASVVCVPIGLSTPLPPPKSLTNDRCRCGAAPSPSSPWWRATPLAGATSCTCSAT